MTIAGHAPQRLESLYDEAVEVSVMTEVHRSRVVWFWVAVGVFVGVLALTAQWSAEAPAQAAEPEPSVPLADSGH